MLNLIDLKVDSIDGDMDLEVSYFFLKSSYPLEDGTFIENDVSLRQVECPDEDGLIRFETMESNLKRIFWAHESKVSHDKDVVEHWETEDFKMIGKIMFDNWV